MAYGIGQGDAVFTTNFSYFATTEVISLVGAHPIFVDIEISLASCRYCSTITIIIQNLTINVINY